MKLDAQHRIILSPLIDSKESHMGYTSAYKENKHTSADQLTASLSDSENKASFRHQRKRKIDNFSYRSQHDNNFMKLDAQHRLISPSMDSKESQTGVIRAYKRTNTPEQNN
jgi:hypothetical protein